MGTEADLRDLLDSVAGEPPHRISLPEVRHRVIRRRAQQSVCAGLAVLVACGLGATLSAVSTSQPGTDAPPSTSSEADMPGFYVESGSSLVVRDTITGRVIARIPVPVKGAQCGQSVAASADQTFFMPCTMQKTASHPYQTVIYRFRLNDSGQVTDLAPVPGGVLRQDLVGTNIAASPDGSEVAAQINRFTSGSLSTAAVPTGILVINTHTGHRALWHTGPYQPGKVQFANATDLSFTEHGTELVAFEARCHRSRELTNCGNPTVIQVRAYSHAARGGSLEGGRVLLQGGRMVLHGGRVSLRGSALKPRGTTIDDAFIAPGGLTLIALLNRCPQHGLCTQTVARIPLGGGSERVLYQVHAGTAIKGVLGRFFSTDPTGRYLILDSQVGQGRVNGWINGRFSHGRLHRLTPVNGSDITYEAW